MLAAGLSMILVVVMAAPATSDAQLGSDTIFGTDVVCIGGATVQGDPAAASMSVGNVYEGTDGSRHLITTGAPLCSFNCADGFDANCDGVRGDYCPPGLDLSRVSDVGTCLAALDAAAAAAADAPSAKIADASSAAPAAATSGAALAHTGNEAAALAVIGGSMLAAGTMVLGLRRKLQD